MTLRVLCDTNVLVSALIADGPPSRLIQEAIDGRLELVLPELVLEELERVLTVKLRFDLVRARAARALLAELAGDRLGPATHVEAVTGDASDDAILACAVEAKVDVLATGDRKHLLPLVNHPGVALSTPQSVLAELRRREPPE